MLLAENKPISLGAPLLNQSHGPLWSPIRKNFEFFPADAVITHEKLADLIDQCAAQVRKLSNMCMIMRFYGYSNQAIVSFRFALLRLFGFDHTDQPNLHQASGRSLRVHHNHDVQRISIRRLGRWNEAEIVRELHASRQHPCQFPGTNFRVPFQLAPLALRRLNYGEALARLLIQSVRNFLQVFHGSRTLGRPPRFNRYTGVNRKRPSLMFARIFIFAALLPVATFAETPAWVTKSNAHTEVLLKVLAKVSPEGAGRMGVDGLDNEILDLTAGREQRARKLLQDAQSELSKRFQAEKDPLVRQDLEILLQATRRAIHSSGVNERMLIPYTSASQLVYGGLKALLDDQVAESRRPAALIRLRKYAGMEPGFRPITELAIERTREKMNKPGLLYPAKAEVESDLANSNFFVSGVGMLLEKYKIKEYSDAYAKFKQQAADYDAFVRREILPKARTDFRLPPELYALALEGYGVDIAPEKLAAMAHQAFTQVQSEMQVLAAKVAKERGFPSSDYRDVIRELKKKQFVGEEILPHYKKRLSDIEQIIRREKLVTLPDRAARIRLATEAESAAVPAPHMQPPRLIGNKGEVGEFVLPLAAPSSKGEMKKFDDDTFDAASWTLTAHEARPGHEMQFSAMVEKGVSAARAIFAFNSTNVEGWGLYSEYIMRPYMPADGQLISLQNLLLRAGRAFLDPELQMGKITKEQALHVLKDEEVLSDAMANSELERYTFRVPGQAVSYFYGYTRLREIRAALEKQLGPRFNQQQFHDFILSQGLLPPDMLKNAVLTNFQ